MTALFYKLKLNLGKSCTIIEIVIPNAIPTIVFIAFIGELDIRVRWNIRFSLLGRTSLKTSGLIHARPPRTKINGKLKSENFKKKYY